MNELDVFERERPRLMGLAYRLLGSVVDADDVVQEAWLRWNGADQQAIDNVPAWLTTVVSRLGLDRLRTRRRQREVYVGPWLPEPLITAIDDPAEITVAADSLTTAFLWMLERLTPEERLVLLLVDVFGESFHAVADVIGKSHDATRQVAVRARRKMRSAELPQRTASAVELQSTAMELASAVLSRDIDQVRRLLAVDAMSISDGGAERHAARRPVIGAARVARFLVNLAKRLPASAAVEPAWVNERPGMVIAWAGSTRMVVTVDVAEGQVTRVFVHVSPSKLQALGHPVNLT
jgi:RNA polymerase sigma-70 factor (ECF subfamily)